MQFDRISLRVFDQNLATAGTGFNFVAEPHTALFQRFDARFQIFDIDEDLVPAAGTPVFVRPASVARQSCLVH